jgi:glycosyltransferase involved in cell wall biosynthesis
MASMKRILLITYSYPPDGEVGSLRVGRFCRYLPTFGINPVILTIQERFYYRTDPTLPAPEGVRVVRTPAIPTILSLYSQWKGSVDNAPAGTQATTRNEVSPVAALDKPPNRLRRAVSAALNFPGRNTAWYYPAVRAGRALLQEGHIAAIFSTGPPFISHRIALRLKQQFGIPWLADLRDPWSKNISLASKSRRTERRAHQEEQACLAGADMVICNTPEMREMVSSAFPGLPEQKFVSLTNGYDDPVFFTPRSKLADSPRVALHLGSLYESRRLDSFSKAIASLVAEGKLDPTLWKFIFVGEVDPTYAAAVKQIVPQLLANGCIEFREPVNWREGQEALQRADILLVFGFVREQEPTVPAKFYEYLPTGKPILAVALDGALANIIRSTGAGLHARADDPSDIAAKFLEISNWPARSPDDARKLWDHQFHYRSLTQRLADWIQQLTASPPTGGA